MPYGLLVSPILFLIYINSVFEHIEKKLFKIVPLSFVKNLSFIASKILIKKTAKVLKKVDNLIIK